ncbi:hypothetical protein IMSAG049_00427 [Clostridiales bacterium]|nr:hypothetical protein IMSAG049_00427 [Clostridiales bacterium]
MASEMRNNLEALMGRLEEFITSKTVVGDPIKVGEVTLLPLVDVSVGLGAGGANSESGGGGLGAKIVPSAVLAVVNGNVQLINIKNQDAVSKLIDMAPGIAAKLNFGSAFGKKNDEDTKVTFEEKTVVEE